MTEKDKMILPVTRVGVYAHCLPPDIRQGLPVERRVKRVGAPSAASAPGLFEKNCGSVDPFSTAEALAYLLISGRYGLVCIGTLFPDETIRWRFEITRRTPEKEYRPWLTLKQATGVLEHLARVDAMVIRFIHTNSSQHFHLTLSTEKPHPEVGVAGELSFTEDEGLRLLRYAGGPLASSAV